MPILPPDTQDDIVNALRVITDSQGRQCLTWDALGRATSYVVCYVSRKQAPSAQELMEALHEDDLADLSRSNMRELTLADGSLLVLQGVGRAAFNQRPRFDVGNNLGRWACVWSMVESYRVPTLFVPGPGEVCSCCIPQRFGFEVTRQQARRGRPSLTHLSFTLENPSCYQDGDLQYCVEGCDAIPLPLSLVESGFDIRIESSPDSVVVEPSPGYEERYRRF